MPYEEATGLGAGISRGLSTGVGLYENIIGGQHQRQMQEQEMGLRQHESDRIDTQTQMALHEARAKTVQDMIEDNARQASAAALTGADVNPYLERSKSLQQILQDARLRAIGPQVLGGYNQARKNAGAVANGATRFQDLSPEDGYNVAALAYPNPTHLIDDYDHPEGTTTFGQHRDNLHNAAAAGDWRGVAEHAGKMVGHAASPYASDDERHAPGIQVAHDLGQDATPHAKAADAIGRLEAVHAGLNSDTKEAQEIQDHIKKAAANGAQDRVDLARQVFFLAGGPKGLETYLGQEPEEEKKFKFLSKHLESSYVASGMDPAQAKAKADKDAIDRVARDQLEIVNQQFSNEQKLQKQKLDAEGGLRSAQADEARARAGYYKEGGHKTGLAATLAPIEEELNDPDTAPERKAALQKIRDDAIQSYAHQHDKLPRGTGEETDAQIMHRAASLAEEQSKLDAARDPNKQTDVRALANQYADEAIARRDKAKAARDGKPAGAEPHATDGKSPDPLVNPATGKPWWEPAGGG